MATRGAWILSATGLSQACGFVYAIGMARLLGPDDFGSFAAATAAAALVVLISGAGLESTSARGDLSDADIRALLSWALLMGVVGGTVMIAFADLWSALWGVPEAASLMRGLAVQVLLFPAAGLISGASKARGRFREFSLIVASGQIVGYLVGFAVASWTSSAMSLTLAPAVSLGVTLACTRVLVGVWVIPSGGLRRNAEHIYFGIHTAGLNVVEYLGPMLLQVGIGRGGGSQDLGLWNRAYAAGATPVVGVLTAFTQVLLPEFGRQRETRSTVDLARPVKFAGWVGGVVATLGATVVGIVLPVLLGSGWEGVGPVAAAVTCASGLQVASAPASAALLARGHFSGLRAVQLLTTTVYLGAAVGCLIGEALPIAAGSVIAVAVIRGVMVNRAARSRELLQGLHPLPLIGGILIGGTLSLPLVWIFA